MSTPRVMRADARRNRDALVSRARALFETGDEQLRFDDFAALSGVGVGTPYRHFPTREALAAAVYEQEVQTLTNLAAQLQQAPPEGGPLAEFLRRMVDHIDHNQRLARRLSTLLSTMPAEMADAAHDLEDAVAALVAQEIRSGTVRPDLDPGALMLVLHSIGAAQDRPQWRTEVDQVLTVLIDGMRPR